MPYATRLAVLLFTDLVDSTALKNRAGGGGFAPLLQRHNALFESAAAAAGGDVLKHTGDGFLAAFATASDAVRAALHFQRSMRLEPWPDGAALAARVGVHVGEVAVVPMAGRDDVVGIAADLAARVMSIAGGGQILLTAPAFNDARQFVGEAPPVDGRPAVPLRWFAHGAYLFKGIDDPVEIFEVALDGAVDGSAAPSVGAAPGPPSGGDKARRVVPHDQEQTLGWRPAVGLPVEGRPGWSLERKLGEGGFGEVWLGHHERTRQRRVFKFCFDADRLRSFKRELTLFRLLRDALGDRPDIARLYEVKLDQPPFFLESEWTEGGNLVDWAESRGGIAAVPLEQRVQIVAQVADAVAAAHSVGVLHKDIKPGNVLIQVLPDGGVQPRLADFGIGLLADRSQLRARHITETGFTVETESGGSSLTGTRLYAPPEVLAGKPFTTQGDIYALGVLLYQMTVGDLFRPLAEGWDREVADPLLREDIAACCDGDPARRPAGAAELSQRIRALPERRMEVARRARLAEADERRHRRLRRSVAATVAMALLAVTVAASSAFYVRRIRAVQRGETAQRLRAEDAERVARASEAAARDEAIRARRLAAYANAQYLLDQERLQAAFAQAGTAYELGGTWEDGYLLGRVVRQARRSWRPIGSIAATGPHRAFGVAGGVTYLIVSDRETVTAFTVPSGEVAGRATLPRTVRSLASIVGLTGGRDNGDGAGAGGAVLASTTDSVVRLELPDLRAGPTTRTATIATLATHRQSPHLAVVETSGRVRVLDARTLDERAHRQFAAPPFGSLVVALSPSGKLFAHRAGSYVHEVTLWDWQADRVSTNYRQAHAFGFADDQTMAGWFGVEGRPAWLWSFEPTQPGDGRVITLPGSTAASASRRLAVWMAQPSRAPAELGATRPAAEGAAHVMGAVIAQEGLDLVDLTDSAHLVRTRYDSIWPFDARFRRATFEPERGLLALQTETQTILFERRNAPGLIYTDFRTVAALKEGLLCAHGLGDQAIAEFTPTGNLSARASLPLGWTSGRPWGAWATPDGSRFAVLRQEGAGPRNGQLGAIESKYTDKVLCVYRASAIAGPERKLTPEHEIKLADFQGIDGRSNRMVALTPDGKVAVAMLAGGKTLRLDVATGQTLGKHQLGWFAIVSQDGRLLAGQDAQGIIIIDVASGQAVSKIPDARGLRRMCFTPDGRELWVGRYGSEIARFAVAGAVASPLGTFRSELLPMAVAPGGERFVGYRHDGAGSGTIMLGDSRTGEPLLVLAPNAAELDSAGFHPEGRYLTVTRSRFGADMFTSLTPEQARQALLATSEGAPPISLVTATPSSRTSTRPATGESPSPQVAIAADDVERIRAALGSRVVIEGRVASAVWTPTQKVMIIEFDGREDERFLGVLFANQRVRFDAAFDGDAAAAFNGATLRITGKVVRYEGQTGRIAQPLEIILEDPAQVTVLAPPAPVEGQ